MKSHALKIFFALSASAFIAFMCGCSAPEASFYPMEGVAGTSFGAPKAAESIQVFVTKKPDYHYKELGIISYGTPSGYSDDPAAYRIMQEKAAQIGADAIIILDAQSSYENNPQVVYDNWGNVQIYDSTRTSIKHRAMAIKRQ